MTLLTPEVLLKTQAAVDQVRFSRLETQIAIQRTRKSLAETRALIVALQFACSPQTSRKTFKRRRIQAA
jgi:hypothetical protein